MKTLRDMGNNILPNLYLVGETEGFWKDLPGYRKPSGMRADRVPPPIHLGEKVVHGIGEELFATIRPAMSYKRRDVRFSHDGLTGVLAARDFEVTVELAPHGGDPSSFRIRKTLSGLRDPELFRHEGFNHVFQSMFQRMEYRPPTPIHVEKWIDRVEERDLEKEWSLEYPPDCSSCRMRLPQTEFDIVVDAESLAIQRHDPAPPSLFWEQLQRMGLVWQFILTEAEESP